MDRIEKIELAIQELRSQLTHHPLYSRLSDIDDIRIFMESHVYAVWDFMSLLKSLQNHLTCTTLPWKPVKNATTARFINEIVWGEESDINENGVPKSHFEMYLDAMAEVNADTSGILALVNNTADLSTIESLLDNSPLEPAVRNFLRFTFQTIRTGQPHKIASAFTFGREDLIPDMFIAIINQSEEDGLKKFPKLTYYLQRHIEVDGDEHGPLSLQMTTELCGDDPQKWDEALDMAQEALKQRIQLWDNISAKIGEKTENAAILQADF